MRVMVRGINICKQKKLLFFISWFGSICVTYQKKRSGGKWGLYIHRKRFIGEHKYNSEG